MLQPIRKDKHEVSVHCQFITQPTHSPHYNHGQQTIKPDCFHIPKLTAFLHNQLTSVRFIHKNGREVLVSIIVSMLNEGFLKLAN